MSFEGYYQALCENGHYCGGDCYMFSHGEPCAECGAKIKWWNLVDQTNGIIDDDPSTMEIELVVKEYKTIKVPYIYEIPNTVCQCCGGELKTEGNKYCPDPECSQYAIDQDIKKPHVAAK